MEDILKDVSDIPLTWLFLGSVAFLVFGYFIRMIQSLQIKFTMLRAEIKTLRTIQTDTNLLKKEFEVFKEETRSEFGVLKERTTKMIRNLQSVTVSAETLAERIKTIECENWTLSKGYDRLIDRISIQEGTVHAMRIMSKEDMVSLTDKLHALEL